MNMDIKKINNSEEKKRIAGEILNGLPRWFGIPESTKDYINASAGMVFYAAYIQEEPAGFIVLKEHNPYSAEIFVMGVKKKYHRNGIGTALMQSCRQYCRERGMLYLQVKTLDESSKDEAYEKTRNFYFKIGFRPLECLPELWDEGNPCLIMIQYLGKPYITDKLLTKIKIYTMIREIMLFVSALKRNTGNCKT